MKSGVYPRQALAEPSTGAVSAVYLLFSSKSGSEAAEPWGFFLA